MTVTDFLIKLTLPDEHSMLKVGAKLASACELGAVIFLQGQLGAGKTTLTRGFLRGLGYQGHVKSPTYTLVESYSLEHKIVHHFDLYRLRDPHELEFMGIQDYFDSKAICLVEWPEYGAGLLPTSDILCEIEVSTTGRMIKLIPQSENGILILHRFENDE